MGQGDHQGKGWGVMSDDWVLAIMYGAFALFVSANFLALHWLADRPKSEVDPFEWPDVPPGECNCYGILPGMTPISKCAECGREIR